MTARHDLDRTLTDWLTDELGPAKAPAYFGETLDLIDRTPQRRAWPWSGLAVPRRWTRFQLPAGAWAVVVVALLVVVLAVAALIGALRQVPPQVPTGPGRILITSGGDITVVNPDGGFTRLSETAVDETMSSWSADGTKVAWWTWMVETNPDGSEDVSVPLTFMNVDGTGQKTLLDGIDPPITTVEGPPAWSPDGRFIAFGAGGKLYKLDVESGALTTLADDGLQRRISPSWSPDGAWIAFVAVPMTAEPGFQPIGPVHLVRADGSDETELPGDPAITGGLYPPSWAADSTRVAYLARPSEPESAPSRVVIATRTGNRWTVATVPGTAPAEAQAAPRWDPASARLAFMLVLPEPTPDGYSHLQLTLVDADLTVRPITERPLAMGFCWSPDGTRIAAVTNDQHLVEIDVATGRQLRDFGVTEVNVGDSCVWSAWAGEPPQN